MRLSRFFLPFILTRMARFGFALTGLTFGVALLLRDLAYEPIIARDTIHLAAFILAVSWVVAFLSISSRVVFQNLNWLLGLPVTRFQLWREMTLTFFVLFAVTLGSAVASVNGFARVFVLGAPHSVQGVAESLWRDFDFSNIDYMSGLFVFTLACCLALALASGGLLVDSADWKKYWTKWSRQIFRFSDKKVDVRSAFLSIFKSVVFGVGIVAVFLSNIPVLVLSFVAIVVSTGLFLTSLRRLSIEKEFRYRLGGTIAGLFLLLFGVFYVAGINQAKDVDPNRRLAAIAALGPLALDLSPTSLSELLEADITAKNVYLLGRWYLNRFHTGAPLRADASGASALSLEKLLAKKQRVESLLAVLDLYDPATFSAETIEAVMRNLDRVGATREPIQKIWAKLMVTPLQKGDLTRLLNSRNELTRLFGEMAVRYYPNGNWGPSLILAFENASDRERLVVLESLSLVSARRFSANDFRSPQQGRHLAAAQEKPLDCALFYPKDWAHISQAKESWTRTENLLNHCLRTRVKMANSKEIEEVEKMGWLEIPLKPAQLAFVLQYYP